MVEIKEVVSKKDIRKFINFPLDLYDGNKFFVPPLYIDELKMFKKNYVYNDQCEHKCFLAYKDNKVVGRIQVILQYASNEKWKQKRVRFTRFDSIDDQEVANALFDKAKEYAKSKGMNEIVGPLGFSDLEREGLLIEGFNELSTFEEQYNYEYYPLLIENYGFEKEVDYVERELRKPLVKDERMKRLSNRMLERFNLHYGKANSSRDFLRKYGDKICEIIDKTYVDIYGTVPFTNRMKKLMIDNFKLIINLKYVAVILDENDNMVCFGICLPSIAKAVQKSKGRLTIPCIIRILKAIRKPEVIDLCLIGVLPEYALRGISSSIISNVMDMLENGLEHAETNLNLVTNQAIISQWKVFDNRVHKYRRVYVKKI